MVLKNHFPTRSLRCLRGAEIFSKVFSPAELGKINDFLGKK